MVGDVMKNYNKLNKDDRKNIIKLFSDGKEVREIPSILNISERGVARVLKESNINTKCRNRYSVDECYFENIDTEPKAYILGLLYAGGFVGNEKFNNIVLSLKKEDLQLLNEIKKMIKFTGELRHEKVTTNYKENAERYYLSFSSKKMANDLRNLGLYPGKSSSMEKIPDIPINLFKHFVRGYFDGDGSIYSAVSTSYHKLSDGKVKVYKYASPGICFLATEKFAEELIEILPVKFKKENCKSENIVYIKNHCRKDIIEMMSFLYDDSTIFMQRKFDKFNIVIGALGKELSS